ncbi:MULTISPECIES: heavy-metal-associated domain-containing protein [unclassified Schaalia]|uniref:heavy-metal-associated domain-containing protein n=1 Tax=unclassified Schaalia TaxID=2691889 RepID=UPI001E3155E2|nr:MULTISPECIES: heavy-metal-associated domain-containing protein [unclassified Schaalia]MCD4550134.1 heavy-metal-associated domain-containing protein [Schaalia sp. lx-260]MCD4557799.1 heavy-metal-associated domain-containing protein [Schaalia sp. lx-100]
MPIDRTVVLHVTGMTCSHCVASITEELEDVTGVLNIEVILNSGGTSQVTVVTDHGVDDQALQEAVTEAGFELVSIHRDF